MAGAAGEAQDPELPKLWETAERGYFSRLFLVVFRVNRVKSVISWLDSGRTFRWATQDFLGNNVTQASDMQLISAAQAGDLDSFGELGRRYFSVLTAIAYAVLGDHHLAEDAAQESLAKALVNLMKLRRTDSFAPWLGRVCRNVAHDMVDRKPAQTLTAEAIQVESGNPDEHEAIHQALARLAPEARELITLRYYNNCSYEQIAAVTGLSGPAINGRLTRAKQKMAAYLKRHAQTEDI